MLCLYAGESYSTPSVFMMMDISKEKPQARRNELSLEPLLQFTLPSPLPAPSLCSRVALTPALQLVRLDICGRESFCCSLVSQHVLKAGCGCEEWVLNGILCQLVHRLFDRNRSHES